MIVILMAIMAAYAPGGASAEASAPATRLVTFGHSWVAGRYPDPALVPWPDRVAAAEHVTLDNRGVGATEAAQTAETVEAYEPLPGDEVVVEAMLNDVRKYGPDGVVDYRRSMRRILEHLTPAVRPGRIVLAVDAPIAAWTAAPGYDRGSDGLLRRYGRALRRLAHRYRARVVDLGRGWKPARHIISDGIHPNEAGTRRIAHRVRRVLNR